MNHFASPALVYVNNLGAKSQRVMTLALNTIIVLSAENDTDIKPMEDYLWQDFTYLMAQKVRQRLIENYAAATVNMHLSALRGVLQETWRLGLMSAEDFHRIADVRNVRSEVLPSGRDISDEVLRIILVSCLDGTRKGVRDFAALAMLATTGMRRAEFEEIELSDFDPSNGALKILKGKGSKARILYVVNKTRIALDEWLMIRGYKAGPLFYSFHKGDKMNETAPMSAQAIYDMIKVKSLVLGVGHITPHDFRRTFIGNMLDAGADPVLLTKITGHASVNMLLTYDRRPVEAKLQAQSLIDLPIE